MESFDIFQSLQFDNNYISNISSICMCFNSLYLDLALYRDQSGPSCGVWLFDEAKRKLSTPHKHHANGMASLHQKTHRSRRNTVWSLFQTWLSSTNTYCTSTVNFFIHHEYFTTHLYIVFEIEPKKQPMWLLCMWAHAIFPRGRQEDDTTRIQCTYNINNNFLHLIPVHVSIENINICTWQIWKMKEDLIEPKRIRAIQESICGFLLDEVIQTKNFMRIIG